MFRRLRASNSEVNSPICPKSNSSEILLLYSVPASLMKIRSKTKSLSCGQYFLHYKYMGAFRCRRNQSFDPICPKSLMLPFLYPHAATYMYNTWSRLANWPQRYSSLKVWTTTTDDDDDGRTADHWFTITLFNLWAFGSGKLTKAWNIFNVHCNCC